MELCGTGIWKLLLGAVYKMVIAAGAYKVMGYFDTGTAWYHWVGYAYAYGIYLFFDFRLIRVLSSRNKSSNHNT